MIAFILCGLTLGALGLLFVVPGAKLYDDNYRRTNKRRAEQLAEWLESERKRWRSKV